MSTIRGVKDRRFKFVQLLNSMFEDQNLSLKAKGLIGFCLTKTENWAFKVDHLQDVLKEGKDSIYSTIAECINQGYAYRYQPRDAQGRVQPIQFIISDSKTEIALIKKELEEEKDSKILIPMKRKKRKPLRKTLETENPEAVFPSENGGSIYSNTDSSNTKQQQKASPSSAAALSSDKKKEKKKPPVYPVLDKVDIPLEEKEALTKNHCLEDVEYAVNWALHPKTVIQTTLVQTIKWACKVKPEMPREIINIEEQNKAYAMKYQGHTSGNYTVEILKKHVEVSCPGAYGTFCLPFNIKGFIEQFISFLRKQDFRILEQN